jgi:hypothetical protein
MEPDRTASRPQDGVSTAPRVNPGWSADRLRHHLRQPLSCTPYLWDLAVAARPGKRTTLVRRDTPLLIEGFSRSGNTYSVAAFAVSNGPDVPVARHLHAAAHVLRAARFGVPILLLVREPRAAVSSYIVRRPTLTVDEGLDEYCDFYRKVWRVRSRLVVGLFDDVVTDFGGVVRQVNQKFGTGFAPYEATPGNEATTMALVEQMNRRECAGELVETHVGRPSPLREDLKATLQAAFEQPRTVRRLATAKSLYAGYAALGTSA